MSVRRSVRLSVTFLNSERFSHYCSCPIVRDWIAVYPALLVVKHAFIILVAYKPLYTLLCLLVRLSLILIFHVCKDTIFTHQPCRRCTMGCLRSKYIFISLWAEVKENALEIKKKKNYWYFDFNRYINYDFLWDINFAILFLYNWFYLFNRMLHNCTPS